MSEKYSNNTEYKIEVSNVPVHWHLENGTVDFLGHPSAFFWINPSLMRMLLPLAEEIGFELYRLLVAYSSSKGTKEDYDAIMTMKKDNFADGFLAWGNLVSVAGWGVFKIPVFDINRKIAVVSVQNPWELIMQKDLKHKFGCPFLLGKIIGILSHALGVNCWADEKIDYTGLSVEFTIYPSEKTILNEINKLRLQKIEKREKELLIEVEKKTDELEKALSEARNARETLEKEISEQEKIQRFKEEMEIHEKYMLFNLADQEYGINILKIHEVISMMPITPVPHLPNFIKGVINIRGKVIPIMDLRLKLGINAADYTTTTCIIIVRTEKILIGFVADSFSGMLNIKRKDIEKVPEAPGFGSNTDYILGIAKIEEKLKILINIDKIVNEETISHVYEKRSFRVSENQEVFIQKNL